MTVTTDIPAQEDQPRYISAAEVCARAQVTYRQLDYWCRLGLLPDREGHGSGVPRRFTEEDVAYLATFAKLVKAGLEHKKADAIMKLGLIENGMVRLNDDIVLVFDPVVSDGT